MHDIENVINQFEYYKQLGEKTFAQINPGEINWRPNHESNSIASIVKHLHGNMLSRWTNFLEEDGEKPWRERDAEFDTYNLSIEEMMDLWTKGWNCLFEALCNLKEEDMNRIIYIRNQGHSVMDAVYRQLAHYPYHIGQIVYIGKWLANERWQSLSVPKGGSKQYNDAHFSQPPKIKHFTEDLLNKE